jgi:hypothetical protein
MAIIVILTVLAIIGSMRDNAAWKKAAEEVKTRKTTYPTTSYIYKKPKTKYIVEVEDVSDGKL